jgi:hypothetical protein
MAEDFYPVKHFVLTNSGAPPETQIEEMLNETNANWSYVGNVVVPGNAGVYLILKRKE